MNKISNTFTQNSFNTIATDYLKYNEIGLWQSEMYIVDKYFNTKGAILDMGCGTGRTTNALFNLGYKNIDGIDFSNNMVELAKAYNNQINYEVGNCLNIDKPDNHYDFAIFSFNGLMQIPKHENRKIALQELFRTLKPNGILFFTTHDRDNGDINYKHAWKNEAIEWLKNRQDQRLYQYGDVISYNQGIEYYIHIPNYNEVLALINECKFTLLESFIRSNKFIETNQIKKFSDDCRFWIIKKDC